ncbi:TPA: NAD-dependent DNA ligase [Vibrio parahaemolyticus]|nr:NAD-dependent DNA ligase [Vibrio parahaemolyticus]HAS6908505.1 NAD-dependent DNA ligase [Vibrio parahaemolyticus]HCG6064958.1 BRCT domain-containing protein [Vibrio parahaemolyticus]HCM0519496.1 BRCT domain-containing protein [Vibrio parahaemolyticus]
MTTKSTAVLDYHGQPQTLTFNYKRNKAKAILTLKGILDGIHADKHLSELEEVYLRAWKDNDVFNLTDGDFIDIHEQIEDILEDGVITTSELIDMQDMLQDILSYGDLEDGGYEGTVNHLLGFLSGISADDTLCDAEIEKLAMLLSQDKHLVSKWPANAIKKRLDMILEDGIVDDSERCDLLSLLKAISGQSLLETGLAYGMSADFSTTQDGRICLKGKQVCFTGKFLSGSRKIQEQKALALGAQVKGNVVKGLDILVLGAVASRDWRFTSYGRKIESVLTYREEGRKIEIINEELWNALTVCDEQ